MNCLTICFLLVVVDFQIDSTRIDSISQVIENAIWQTSVTKIYDPSYVIINYPDGDIPMERGVCCDVIVRAFRSVGIDLQKEIHNDMENAFDRYPQIWGLNKPDTNIDHRRVPNIMTYLQRQKKVVPVSRQGKDYKPGDIVTWKIPGNLDHIGVVTNIPVENSDRFKVVHNIGSGAQLEDVLFEFEITGHYRYFFNP
jgi:uncharacterized protein YijF (DUF1287 family)